MYIAVADELNIQIISGDDHTPIEITLVDLDGKVVLQKSIQATFNLDHKLMQNGELKSGVYMATIKQGSSII